MLATTALMLGFHFLPAGIREPAHKPTMVALPFQSFSRVSSYVTGGTPNLIDRGVAFFPVKPFGEREEL